MCLVVCELFLVGGRNELENGLCFFTESRTRAFLISSAVTTDRDMVTLEGRRLLYLFIRVVGSCSVLPNVGTLRILRLGACRTDLLITVNVLAERRLRVLARLVTYEGARN